MNKQTITVLFFVVLGIFFFLFEFGFVYIETKFLLLMIIFVLTAFYQLLFRDNETNSLLFGGLAILCFLLFGHW